jgi:hypothetical protein
MNHQTRRDDLPDTPWASDALCVDMPAEIFAGTNARLQTAKAACAHCTVARQCLRWAITTEIEDEIWGGRTPAERRRITVAFVLDPPLMSSAPGRSRPVDPVGPEIPSEPIAEPLRRVGQGVRPKKLSSPASTDVAVRGPKTRTSAPAECGTEAGYKRHRRLDEQTCEDCRRAVRDAQADRAARHAAGIPVATRSKVAPCGTPAGYARHRNQGEDACDRCTQANKNYLQTYRAQTRNAAS